jgi:nucleoside-diphosphate-sugar epimerase
MVLDNLRNNKEVIIKSGDLKKDYIYTKDIASAFASFIDSDIEGAVNICTGNAISIKEYVLTLAKAMGKEDLIIFKNELSSQPPIIVGNNSRLVNEVKYKIKYPLNLAIMDILNTQKKENIYD